MNTLFTLTLFQRAQPHYSTIYILLGITISHYVTDVVKDEFYSISINVEKSDPSFEIYELHNSDQYSQATYCC